MRGERAAWAVAALVDALLVLGQVHNVRRALIAITILALGGGLTGVARAEAPGLGRRHHLWGQCAPGAWKLVRVVTDTLDDKGTVQNSTMSETKTTLVDIDDNGVTLEVRTLVQFGGRHFESQPQVLRQSYHGEIGNQEWHVTPAGMSSLVIDEQRIACHVEQSTATNATAKIATTVCYSDTVAPYVLKRESVKTDAASGQVLDRTTSEVVSLNMPEEVLLETQSTAHVRTVCSGPAGSTWTLSVVSSSVPGGVVWQSSKETDKDGHVVRRSFMKVLSYSLEAEEERVGLFGRRRPRSFHKPTPVPIPPPATQQPVSQPQPAPPQ